MTQEKPTVLLIGGSGFIGQHTTQALTRLGAHIVHFDRTRLTWDDDTAVAKYLNTLTPDAIICLASPAPRDTHMTLDDLVPHLSGLQSFIRHMPSHAHFIYTGSMAEFGSSGTHDEIAPRRPNTPYGFLKATAVDRVTATLCATGKSGTIARLFGVYGPGEASNRLLPSMIAQLCAGQAVALSDGTQLRDFVYVHDVADILATLALAPQAGVQHVNVGTGQGLTVRTLCEQMADILGQPRDLLNFGAIARQSHDEDTLIANVTKLTHLFGTPPPHRLSDPTFLISLADAFAPRQRIQ